MDQHTKVMNELCALKFVQHQRYAIVMADKAFWSVSLETCTQLLITALITPIINFTTVFMESRLTLWTLYNGIRPFKVVTKTALAIGVQRGFVYNFFVFYTLHVLFVFVFRVE